MDVGQNFDSVGFLNGGPHFYHSHFHAHQRYIEPDAFWESLVRHKRAKEIITAKSSAKQPKGIIRSHHAYIVVDYFELFSGTRYILLKNPWGYQGARLENKNGYLFLKLEDYLAAMDYTYINYDTYGWHQGYFMMWDDPAEQNGGTYVCGPECTQHRLFVRSEVKQAVFIGANTYSLYTYPDAIGECPVSQFDPQL